ncbi:MAG: type VI secretion system accessory protein TagJ, partial [Planctomycetota bacterium]
PVARDWDQEEQLGRRTDWHEHPGGFITGTGQRSLLVGDEARGVLELSSDRFGKPAISKKCFGLHTRLA